MARPLRFQYPGAFYHVMNRGANRKSIFFNPIDDRLLFLKVLAQAVEKWKIRIHAYSLMPNHYHLLIETPLGNLSRALRHIDGIYTQKINQIYHRDGPLLRGRFKSILVQEETYFLELVRYIHLNAVRAKIVPSPELDPHSSHSTYLGLTPPLPWLTQHAVFRYFPGTLLQQGKNLDAFVKQGIGTDLEKILTRKKWPAILGLKGFILDIRKKFNCVARSKDESDIPQRKEIRKAKIISAGEIINELLCEFKLPDVSELQNAGKWICMYFLRNESHLTHAEIGEIMGGLTEGAVRKFLQRSSYLEHPSYKKLVDYFEDHSVVRCPDLTPRCPSLLKNRTAETIFIDQPPNVLNSAVAPLLAERLNAVGREAELRGGIRSNDWLGFSTSRTSKTFSICRANKKCRAHKNDPDLRQDLRAQT
jgi:putative transposase